MATKPHSNESKKPVSDADVRRHVTEDAAEEPQARQAGRAASPAAKGAPGAPVVPEVPSGFARYTIPAHLGSAAVAGPDGVLKTYEGGAAAVMSREDAERIGATPEGEADHPRGGTIDAMGSTRADQIPPRTTAPASPVKASKRAEEEDAE